MGLNIKIDLENVYKAVSRNTEQRATEFDTVLTTSERIRLGIKISLKTHPFIRKTYNLAFGPLRSDGGVNDKVRLSYQDHSKVF